MDFGRALKRQAPDIRPWNDALRKYLSETDQPLTERALRQILRREMPEYLRGLTAGSTATARKRAAR